MQTGHVTVDAWRDLSCVYVRIWTRISLTGVASVDVQSWVCGREWMQLLSDSCDSAGGAALCFQPRHTAPSSSSSPSSFASASKESVGTTMA